MLGGDVRLAFSSITLHCVYVTYAPPTSLLLLLVIYLTLDNGADITVDIEGFSVFVIAES